MLPASHRLRRSDEFSQTVRLGARSAKPTVVVHWWVSPHNSGPAAVGFVVSKAVGGAVVRNMVKRRLRAILAGEVGRIPVGVRIVVRALPPAKDATFDSLRQDVLHAMDGAQRRSVRAQIRTR